MQVKLTPKNVFDLDINGKVFKDMRITGELDGVREMKNETSTVTLIRNGSGLGSFIQAALSSGVEEDWVPVRGSPDIVEAFKAGLVEPAASTEKGQYQATIDEMVTRFLGWRLPHDFSPDGGISFVRLNATLIPTGTNLLTGEQAKAMLQYLLSPLGTPQKPVPPPSRAL